MQRDNVAFHTVAPDSAIEENLFWEAGDGRLVDFVIAVDVLDTAWVHDRQESNLSEEQFSNLLADTTKTEPALIPVDR
jgi:hypothetical protein